MNPDTTNHPEQSLKAEILTLINSRKSLQLATLNDKKLPEASYTPFIYQAPEFYIFVSALASHTQNLIAHPQCSLMLIEDEVSARNLFARTRLTFTAHATIPASQDSNRETILDSMEELLGSTMKMIRTLPDFKLIRLGIKEGRFVKGFGAAFSIKDENFEVIEQVMGK